MKVGVVEIDLAILTMALSLFEDEGLTIKGILSGFYRTSSSVYVAIQGDALPVECEAKPRAISVTIKGEYDGVRETNKLAGFVVLPDDEGIAAQFARDVAAAA